MLRVNSAGLCSCTLLLKARALLPPGQQPRPGVAAFGFGTEGHKAFKNKCQKIKKGLESWLQGGGGGMALALSFRLDGHVPAMLPAPPGLLASLPPLTSGCCRQRTAVTFPLPRRLAHRGPFAPSPSVWKKGPRLPPGLPQEMRSLEVRGQPAAPPEGRAAQRWALHRAGTRRRAGEGGRALEGGGRGPGSSCLCDYQTPKKGKGLGKLIALGRAPASDCL